MKIFLHGDRCVSLDQIRIGEKCLNYKKVAYFTFWNAYTFPPCTGYAFLHSSLHLLLCWHFLCPRLYWCLSSNRLAVTWEVTPFAWRTTTGLRIDSKSLAGWRWCVWSHHNQLRLNTLPFLFPDEDTKHMQSSTHKTRSCKTRVCQCFLTLAQWFLLKTPIWNIHTFKKH